MVACLWPAEQSIFSGMDSRTITNLTDLQQDLNIEWKLDENRFTYRSASPYINAKAKPHHVNTYRTDALPKFRPHPRTC